MQTITVADARRMIVRRRKTITKLEEAYARKRSWSPAEKAMAQADLLEKARVLEGLNCFLQAYAGEEILLIITD